MKKILISTAAFALVTAASIFDCSATAATDNSRVPNVDNNVEFPSSSWRLVKHVFRVHVPRNNNALDQLIIDTPPTVAVSNDIDVLNEKGQTININISVNGRRIIIGFPEKVISNTKLLIELNKVKQPTQGPASVYRLSAKVVGSDEEIPVGVAQFPKF
ncbi:hypothetical protein WA1_50010 [Scytonema hofmannii PCC 7110]|uniref:DUF2808 domain-containing protein n=1 Tax=Scytonema hofmannii PCC 7110 TaxID=128403 RepID=A0A139WR12_9CYAN|nr:DUF2808 domain-containing protein [Scytonema hofmannii]KYC34866.1 hypothetical protein WA1_50010 [Scytonema hofmannii PCC 7110]